MGDYFRKVKSLYASTTNTFGTGTSVTITPNSVSGLPTDTEITLTFDRVDSSGTETPNAMERIIGTISGGNFVVRTSPSTGRGADGTSDAAHTSPVVEYIPNAKDMNDAIDGILVEHNQDGTHKETALDSMIAGSEAQGDIIYHNGTIWTRLAKGTDGQVLTQASNVPSWAAASTGEIAQVVTYVTGAVATGTTVIPNDDTIPQNTEGNEYMTLAITPTNASSTLVIQVIIQLNGGANQEMIAALFQDTTANALAAIADNLVSGEMRAMGLTHKMTAGTTSATTFKVRAGGSNAGTTTFNGNGGTRRFGGVCASSIVITEILP